MVEWFSEDSEDESAALDGLEKYLSETFFTGQIWGIDYKTFKYTEDNAVED